MSVIFGFELKFITLIWSKNTTLFTEITGKTLFVKVGEGVPWPELKLIS